jgi:thiol-disulfide isomerase/thioredoxin
MTRLRHCFFAALLLFVPATASIADSAPSARTLEGTAFDPRGHVTIVHYWATWCAPCRAEMPILDTFYRKHHAQGLEMLAVSIDDGISSAKLKQHSAHLAFPVARVDDVKIARQDIPSAIPVTRIYDRDGRLIFETKADGRAHLDAATLERIAAPFLR